jgi:beta-lactamase superfamily II metal-dependent hydrolase
VLGAEAEAVKVLADQLKTDQSVANGTSIAFLAEFGGKSCLFLGDAHTDVICKSIRSLIPDGKTRLKVDAVKIAHHGSKANISEDLMNLLDARYFLVSTNGDIFKHPDKSAIKTVIERSNNEPVLCFNYHSPQNKIWEKPIQAGSKRYIALYPEEGCEGMLIEL